MLKKIAAFIIIALLTYWGEQKKDCIAAVLEGKVKKTVYRYVMANRLVPGEVPADLPFDHCYGFTIA